MGLMNAGWNWCLFLPVGEKSSEQGSTDNSLDGRDPGDEYDGYLGEYSCWGDSDERGVWCVLGSSNNLDLASM